MKHEQQETNPFQQHICTNLQTTIRTAVKCYIPTRPFSSFHIFKLSFVFLYTACLHEQSVRNRKEKKSAYLSALKNLMKTVKSYFFKKTHGNCHNRKYISLYLISALICKDAHKNRMNFSTFLTLVTPHMLKKLIWQ